MKPIIIAGMEIEANYNGQQMPYLEDNKSGYHDADETYFGDYYVENDGSIHCRKFDETAEFISKPFNVVDYKQMVENFINATRDEADMTDEEFNKHQLSDFFDFNSSCGCHIHLSVYADTKRNKEIKIPFKDEVIRFNGTEFSFKDLVSFELLKKIKSQIKARIKKRLPEVYPAFSKQYTRPYARATRQKDYGRRENDWNLTCYGRNHLEFRAFNLNGVKTWDDFRTIMEIAYSTIHEIISEELKKNKPFEERRRLSVEYDLKKIKEQIVGRI